MIGINFNHFENGNNRLRDKANADDLIRMKIDELLLELSANKTEEAGEQKHKFEKQLEERILDHVRLC